MKIEDFSFGSIKIDGETYEHDVVSDGERIRKRKKQRSRQFCAASGHTPLSIKERVPWKCRRLVIGTGASGALPVMDEIKQEAVRRRVELAIEPTVDAIASLRGSSERTNAILHVTCRFRERVGRVFHRLF
jgi:hypothetical protein